MEEQKNRPLQLLWTGGWDSTFRLLEAVIHIGTSVQPYYVVDVGRKSTFEEIKAMDRIKSAVGLRGYEVGRRILPIQIAMCSDLPDHTLHSAQYLRLKQRIHFGTQYEWLPKFADAFDLHGLEICIAKHAETRGLQGLLGKCVVEKREDGAGVYWTLPDSVEDDDLRLFGRFRFPTLYRSKSEMRSLAKEYGFLDVLELSWFCHKPINGETCGLCVPCNDLINDGMGYRLNSSGHRRYRVNRAKMILLKPFRVAKPMLSARS